MARGVRKTTLEKLQDELLTTKNSMEQYESALSTLREREKNISEQIELEELKSLRAAMEDLDMTVEEVKELLLANRACRESA